MIEDKKIPSLDEIVKKNPSKESDSKIEYPDDDEEEDMDTNFPLSEVESKYYDEEGNFHPDGVEKK